MEGGREEGREGGREGSLSITHLGTTGSSLSFLASTASFHRAVQRHHLQPGSRPMLRKLLPREAEKSRNSRVRTPVYFVSEEGICEHFSQNLGKVGGGGGGFFE